MKPIKILHYVEKSYGNKMYGGCLFNSQGGMSRDNTETRSFGGHAYGFRS